MSPYIRNQVILTRNIGNMAFNLQVCGCGGSSMKMFMAASLQVTKAQIDILLRTVISVCNSL
jgi:hypothetical protein